MESHSKMASSSASLSANGSVSGSEVSGKRLKRWISNGKPPVVKEVLSCGDKLVPYHVHVCDDQPLRFVELNPTKRANWVCTAFGWSSMPHTWTGGHTHSTVFGESKKGILEKRGVRAAVMWKGKNAAPDLIRVNIRGKSVKVLNSVGSSVFLDAEQETVSWFIDEWYADLKTMLNMQASSQSTFSDSVGTATNIGDSDDDFIGTQPMFETTDHMPSVDSDDELGDDSFARNSKQIETLKHGSDIVRWIPSRHGFQHKKSRVFTGVSRKEAWDTKNYIVALTNAKLDAEKLEVDRLPPRAEMVMPATSGTVTPFCPF
jgi:hypothetical protein